jgi:hypothetical protein
MLIVGRSDDKINNLVIQDVGAEKDTITNLRAPTHFGRPNVGLLFTFLRDHSSDGGGDSGISYLKV